MVSPQHLKSAELSLVFDRAVQKITSDAAVDAFLKNNRAVAGHLDRYLDQVRAGEIPVVLQKLREMMPAFKEALREGLFAPEVEAHNIVQCAIKQAGQEQLGCLIILG